jgi:hypothetical protein
MPTYFPMVIHAASGCPVQLWGNNLRIGMAYLQSYCAR